MAKNLSRICDQMHRSPTINTDGLLAIVLFVEFCEVLGAFSMPRDFNGCHFCGGVTVRAVS
ncbi:hypothetical protein [Planktomarina temperata]|uniref:hypothetical protein n=1 Tax=Planktomarina temperata TaxID=1284658 RepID=UPI0035C7FD55